jgi:transcriptional regulator with PAS, ATPase and Fis domain
MVEDGSFRRDLFYRVSVIPLHVPPLRERREDIPHLADHFVRKFSTRSGKQVVLSDDAITKLESRTWKGNVRELEHTIERAVALTRDGEPIVAEHCCENGTSNSSPRAELPPDGIHLPGYLNNLEKEFVLEALDRCGGSQTRAAALLQIPVHSLRHLLEKHGLR